MFPTQVRDRLDVSNFTAPEPKRDKLVGSAALVKLIEENLRVNMIPRVDYAEEVSRTRGFSHLSNLIETQK